VIALAENKRLQTIYNIKQFVVYAGSINAHIRELGASKHEHT